MKSKYLIIDNESYKMQSFYYTDIVNKYKELLNKNNQNNNDILDVLKEENYLLKSSLDSLMSNLQMLDQSVNK
jgi:hypothetical protein